MRRKDHVTMYPHSPHTAEHGPPHRQKEQPRVAQGAEGVVFSKMLYYIYVICNRAASYSSYDNNNNNIAQGAEGRRCSN